MSVAGQDSIFILIILGEVITFSAIKAAEINKDEVWAKALPQVVPSENECRPYIEKAIKKLTTDSSADNNDDSTDQNQDERSASPSDDENLPDICTATSDRQNEAEKKEETETPVVHVSEMTADGEEVIVPNKQADEEEEQQKKDDEQSEQTTEQYDNEIGDVKVDQATESDSNEDDEEKSPTKVHDDSDKFHNEKQTPDDKVNDDVPDKGKASNTADSETQIQDTDEEGDHVKNTDDDKDDDNKEEHKTEEDNSLPEEELAKDRQIPKKLRSRTHIEKILNLEKEESAETEKLKKLTDSTLKELKKLYENAIKPMETLYKYRDLSNRHFGDPEIFSKPLVLFMGPWSGGKSIIINHLLENEFSETALKTGAEPSPVYFNIVTYNENETILDGTQLAADWTFSGLQKFGQGLLDRLKGLQLPHPLLEKMHIVEIPGILEIRKQVERVFPFNGACQWFIDRADVIFLVYDPSKLDVGPETEAILDQLKGREYQKTL